MAGSEASRHPVVHVVDDDPDFRDTLRALLVSKGLDAKCYGSAESFLNACDHELSGCLLLDLRMSGMSGLSLQQELSRRCIGIPVIVMTAYGDVATAVRAMKAGAADFVQKPFDVTKLLGSIETALQDGARSQLLEADRSEAVQRLASLTEREREVLDAVVAGQSNRSIAETLDISPRPWRPTARTLCAKRVPIRSLPLFAWSCAPKVDSLTDRLVVFLPPSMTGPDVALRPLHGLGRNVRPNARLASALPAGGAYPARSHRRVWQPSDARQPRFKHPVSSRIAHRPDCRKGGASHSP